MVKDLEYLPPLGESDHICLKFQVTLCQYQNQITPPKVFNVFKTNYEALRTELDKYDWQELLDSNFEDDYEKFFNILKDLQRQHTPLKTPSKSKKTIYMTKEALRLKKSVNRHWKKYKTTGSKHDKDSYTLRKNKLRKLTRNLRHNFEQCTAAELKNKPKTF